MSGETAIWEWAPLAGRACVVEQSHAQMHMRADWQATWRVPFFPIA